MNPRLPPLLLQALHRPDLSDPCRQLIVDCLSGGDTDRAGDYFRTSSLGSLDEAVAFAVMYRCKIKPSYGIDCLEARLST